MRKTQNRIDKKMENAGFCMVYKDCKHGPRDNWKRELASIILICSLRERILKILQSSGLE